MPFVKVANIDRRKKLYYNSTNIYHNDVIDVGDIFYCILYTEYGTLEISKVGISKINKQNSCRIFPSTLSLVRIRKGSLMSFRFSKDFR